MSEEEFRDTAGRAAARGGLRYAVVGAGVMGEIHIRELAALGVSLAAVVDADPDRATAAAGDTGAAVYADLSRMLAESRPDVVVVATPHVSHCALAIECLEGGAHVLVEKPMALDVGEARAMAAAAEAAGRLLAVDLQYRFLPAIAAARDFIAQGRLGELLRGTFSESMFRSAAFYQVAQWRGAPLREGGGVLMNQAPHVLDLLCYLAGPLRSVAGWTRTLVHDVACEDTALALVETAEGAVLQIAVSTAEPTP